MADITLPPGFRLRAAPPAPIEPTPVPGGVKLPPGFRLRDAAPIRPTPVPEPSTMEVVGQNITEAGKGIPAGVGSLVGSAITGIGTNLQQSNYDQLALMDRVDRGESVPEMEDPAGYSYMDPEQRKQFRATVQGGVDTPIADLPLVQAGRAVTRESNLFPAAPGYEQSPGRMVGEGLGSVAGGVGVAMIPGAGPIAAPALYTASGSGQAAEQAMQDPKATREQVVDASLAGAGPGATDTLPLETLIGAVPLPGAKVLAKVPGILGAAARGGARMLGQGGVEMLQEGGQQVAQNFVAQQVYNPEQDLMEGAAVNAAAGGGTGILAEIGRLIVSAVTGRHGRGVPAMNGGQAQQQGDPSPGAVPPAAGGESVTPTAAPPQGEPLPQGAPPAAVASPTTFTTAKGSTYVVNPDGTTTRDKAFRPEHGHAEQGPQPQSEATFYLSPDDANKLAGIQARGGAASRVVVQNGHAALQFVDGPDAGKIWRDTVVQVGTAPAVGLLPVELWDQGTRVHFGNPIVEVGVPAAPGPAGDPGAGALPPPPPDIPALTDAWTQVMTEIGAGTPTPEQSQLRGSLEAQIQAAGGKIPDPLPIIQKARSQAESSLRMGMQRAAEGTQPVEQIIAAENIEADLPAEERIWRDAVRVAQGAGGVSMAELRRQLRLSPAQARQVIQRMEAEGLVGPAGGNFSKRPWIGAVPTPTAGLQQDPVQVQTPMDADLAASRAVAPTEGQAEAGNYQMGHLNWQGMDVTIETPRGGQRTGTDATGAPWSVTMPAHYGYIKTAAGADGDKLDVYLGPDPAAPQVFVIDQIDPDTGAFDEHKVILGAKDEAEARQLYEAGFSDGRGEARLGAITPMPVDSFQQMIDEWNPGSPLAYEDPAAMEPPPPNEPDDLVPDYLAGLDDPYEDAPFDFEDTPQGAQALVPGVSAVADADRLALQSNAPLRGRRPQQAADEGLFDVSGRGQQDLIDLSRQADVIPAERVRYWSDLVKQARAQPTVRKGESLLGFIRARGGLRRSDSNVRSALRDAKLAPGVINSQGMMADDATLAAWEAGYFPAHEERPDLQAFYDAIEQEAQGGDPIYPGQRSYVADEEGELRQSMDRLMDEAGVTLAMKPEEAGRRLAAHERMVDQIRHQLPQLPPGVQRLQLEGLTGLSAPDRRPADVDKAMRAAAAALRRIVPQAKVELIDALFSEDGQLQPYGGLSTSDLVVLTAMSVDPARTARHEAIHALRNFGVISNREWAILEAQAPAWRQQFQIDERYAGNQAAGSESELNEEAVADAYAEWARGGWDGADTRVQRIFRKIQQVLLRIRAAVRRAIGRDPDVNDLFAAIESGRIGARGGSVGGTAMARAAKMQRFQQAAEETNQSLAAFIDWFAGSKVVDENGLPQLVFHGTNSGNIEAFDGARLSDDSLFGPGIYLTENPAVASGYAKRKASFGYGDTVSDLKTLRDYFTPGRLLPSNGMNRDRVVSFNEANGNWSVTVERVDNDGATLPGHMRGPGWRRTHATAPYRRDVDAALAGEKVGPNVLPLYASIKNPLRLDEKTGPVPWQRVLVQLYKDGVIGADEVNQISRQLPQSGTGEEFYSAVGAAIAELNDGYPLRAEITRALKGLGYDGITHIGGSRVGDRAHRVWIAFAAPQVKSQFNVGTWGRDTDQIRFALPSQRQQMAATALNTVMGGPKLPMPDDLGWLGKAILSPYHIAAVDSDFEPVFGTQLEMNERRSRIATTLFRQLEPYFRASTADKVAVNAVLEMGRLEKVDYRHQQGPTITAANPGAHKHAIIQPGQSRTLTPRQSQLFRAVRGAMDTAIRMMRNAYLIEQGFGKPGDPKTPGQFRALASLATSAREQKKMLEIADTLDTINQSQQTGYVPFTRYGDHYINVRDVNGVVVHSERVEKGPMRRRRAARLRQKLEAMYPAGQFKVDDIRFGVDPRKDLGVDKLDFVALGRLAEQGGASQAERDAYEQYLREGLSKSGFRSHFINSKNLPGYSQDFERAIADYVMGLSGYLARRATREKLRNALDMIPRAKKRLKRYAEDYAQYTTTPTEEFQRLRTWMFFASLAGNISSAVVNVSQIPIASYPWLSMVSNPARASWELTKASKDVLKAFRPRLAGDALYFDVNALPAADRAEMQALLDEGTLVPQATIEQMGVAQSRNQKLRGLKKRTGFVVDLLGSMFGAAERFNRMVTALAMLRMMRDPAFAQRATQLTAGNKIAQAKSAAAPLTPLDGARLAVDETQFVQGKVNRQSVMRNYGAVILQFSGFMANMLQLQARMAGKYGTRGKAALGLQLGILLMFGGLFGLPGAETLKSLIEAILGVASGHDVDIEKEMTVALADIAGGKDASQLGLLAAEAARRGVFRAAGVDVSQRIGMGNVAPGQDLGREASAWEHMMSLSPIGQVPQRVLQAFQAHQRGDDTAAAVALSPLVLSAGGGNIARALTMEMGGLRSRAGDMLIPKDKITPADVALRAVGFQSSHIARAFEQYGMENRLDTAMQQMNRNYARAIAIATLQQDGAEVQRLRGEIASYNQGRPLAEQITVSQQAVRNAVGRELEGIGARRRTKRTAEAREQIDNAIPDTTIFDALRGEGDTE